MEIKEKKHRLERSEYRGFKRVSYTFCVENKNPVFSRIEVIDKFVEILKGILDKHAVRNWIYVFMPDHVHVVLEGMRASSDMWQAMKDFKQITGFWLAQNGGPKWQKDYYDHIHRENENIYYCLKYIMNNPVRKGIVSDCLDYKGLGSLDFSIGEIVERIQAAERLEY